MKAKQLINSNSTNFNYSFILKCLIALTGAAIVASAILLGLSLHSTVIVTPLLLAAATAASITASFLGAMILPIAALVVIGTICALPFCFGGCSKTRSRFLVSPSSLYQPQPRFYGNDVYVPGTSSIPTIPTNIHSHHSIENHHGHHSTVENHHGHGSTEDTHHSTHHGHN